MRTTVVFENKTSQQKRLSRLHLDQLHVFLFDFVLKDTIYSAFCSQKQVLFTQFTLNTQLSPRGIFKQIHKTLNVSL